MIYYESWSPSPLYVNRSMHNYEPDYDINDWDGWYPEQPYNETIFPDLTALTKKSLNFLSLATPGLPTV